MKTPCPARVRRPMLRGGRRAGLRERVADRCVQTSTDRHDSTAAAAETTSGDLVEKGWFSPSAAPTLLETRLKPPNRCTFGWESLGRCADTSEMISQRFFAEAGARTSPTLGHLSSRAKWCVAEDREVDELRPAPVACRPPAVTILGDPVVALELLRTALSPKTPRHALRDATGWKLACSSRPSTANLIAPAGAMPGPRLTSSGTVPGSPTLIFASIIACARDSAATRASGLEQASRARARNSTSFWRIETP